MGTAGRIWEADSVQLATKEVRLTLILRMHGTGGSPRGSPSKLAVNLIAGVVSVMGSGR